MGQFDGFCICAIDDVHAVRVWDGVERHICRQSLPADRRGRQSGWALWLGSVVAGVLKLELRSTRCAGRLVPGLSCGCAVPLPSSSSSLFSSSLQKLQWTARGTIKQHKPDPSISFCSLSRIQLLDVASHFDRYKCAFSTSRVTVLSTSSVSRKGSGEEAVREVSRWTDASFPSLPARPANCDNSLKE